MQPNKENCHGEIGEGSGGSNNDGDTRQLEEQHDDSKVLN